MDKTEIVINYGYGGFNPVLFGSESCEPGHFFGPAVRNHWLLHYVVQGFGIFVRDGVTRKVGPGEIFVIPPYEETYYEADKVKPWRYIWIGFTTEEEIPAVLNTPVLRCPGVGVVFEDMLRCAEFESGRSAFLASRLWELLAVLLEQGREREGYLEKALNCINSEYMNGITIRQVADRLNLDRSYFSGIFKSQMGISPQAYLVNLRLQKAAELMTLYGATPTTACLSVGYADIYHFSKIFKQHFGMSPRNYQKQAEHLL